MNYTRRNFLKGVGAAAMTTGIMRGESGTENPIPAIDTHTHFYDPTRPQGVPWPSSDNSSIYSPHYPRDFMREAGAHHVLGTVVVEASDWVEDNAWILDLAATNDEIVGLIGNLRPGRPEFAENLLRFSQNPLFLGLRLRGEVNQHLHEDAVLADLKRLVDLDQTLDVHGGLAILAPTLELARRFPSLRLVINHLPFTAWDDDVPALRAALKRLAQCPQVYVKVSAVVRKRQGKVVVDPEFYRPGLDALCDLFGPDRMIYGSNWPVCERIAPYADVRGVVDAYYATRGRHEAEKFFWGNSFEAYRWIPRGPAEFLASG